MSSSNEKTELGERPGLGVEPGLGVKPGPVTASVCQSGGGKGAAGAPVCPVCRASALIEIRGKLQCSRCHVICETCCEGGRG